MVERHSCFLAQIFDVPGCARQAILDDFATGSQNSTDNQHRHLTPSILDKIPVIGHPPHAGFQASGPGPHTVAGNDCPHKALA